MYMYTCVSDQLFVLTCTLVAVSEDDEGGGGGRGGGGGGGGATQVSG